MRVCVQVVYTHVPPELYVCTYELHYYGPLIGESLIQSLYYHNMA